MNKKYYVYELWNPLKNQVFYVGKSHTKYGKTRRLYQHINQAKDYRNKKSKEIENIKSSHKINTILKIIDSDLEVNFKVVFETDHEIEALEKEIELINFYGRRDLKTGILTNITGGGEGVSERIFTQEELIVRSEAVKGEKNPRYGIKYSEKERQLHSNKMKEYYALYPEKCRPKKVIVPKIKKQRNIIAKKIYKICLDTGIILEKFNSAKEASLSLFHGIIINSEKIKNTISEIHKVCKSKFKSAKGFIWRYVSNYDEMEFKDFENYKKKKIKNSSGKPIAQKDLTGNIIKIWNKSCEISKFYGKNKNWIRRYARTGKSYDGFIWEYI